MTRSFLVVAVLLAAASLATIAAAEKPMVLSSGRLEMDLTVDVAPLSPERSTAALAFAARVSTLDGTHPPPLRELYFELRGGPEFNAGGLPVCPVRSHMTKSTASVESVCRDAVVGRGEVEFEVMFPEMPVPVQAPLLILSGGSRGGAAMLYARALLAVPAPAVVVMPIEITGGSPDSPTLGATIKVPEVAGDGASLISLTAKIGKRFFRAGRAASLLIAQCRKTFFAVRARARFGDAGGPNPNAADAEAQVGRRCRSV